MVQVHVEVTRGEVMEETSRGRGGGEVGTGGRGGEVAHWEDMLEDRNHTSPWQ